MPNRMAEVAWTEEEHVDALNLADLVQFGEWLWILNLHYHHPVRIGETDVLFRRKRTVLPVGVPAVKRPPSQRRKPRPVDDFAGFIARSGGGSLFWLYTLVVWGSVVISAFVDNIPYVATMLPVLAAVTRSLGIEPYLLYYGLLTGATLGGNITPIGASANIAATGLLKKEGYESSFGDFMRIGVPYTLTAVLVGYLYLWIVWA